jgi:hypothetical protein
MLVKKANDSNYSSVGRSRIPTRHTAIFSAQKNETTEE